MFKQQIGFATISLVATLLSFSAAFADDAPSQILTIQNKLITPSEFTAPAGQKIKIIVKNEDNDAAEFESSDFHREKVVPAHGEVTIYIGPLKAGTYSFFNDFDPDHPNGHITVQ
jgi:hypothetical protein